MTRIWSLCGVCGVAIIAGCMAAFIFAAAPDPDFIRNGHVVVNGTDFGAPGEKAFLGVVEAEGLVGSDELRAIGRAAYGEVHDVAQLYCSLRAQHSELDAEELVPVATEAFNERYARARSTTEAVLREAAAAEAAKYWCPSGYIDAGLAAPAIPRRRQMAAARCCVR
jgi:hypothetical protein